MGHMSDVVRCVKCDAEINFWEDKCPVCGTFHSFPNVRKAEQEAPELSRLYDTAIKTSIIRTTDRKVAILKSSTEAGKIVVNTPLDFIYELIKDAKTNYVGYFRQVDAAVRKAAIEQHHIDRSVADNILFPNYLEHMVYAALSNSGVGLSNYGFVAVFLKDAVAPLKVSLLIENSYRFLKKHYKFSRPLPTGCRATWNDRGKLAVIKHGAEISPTTSDDAIKSLILRPGPTLEDDDFIEVHIYDGFDKRAVERVVLNRPFTNPRDQNRWQELTELLTAEGIDFGNVGGAP
jgi:hypothetical protein